jgi:ribosomal protein RSM22 (predicted rRNA methylase)
MGADAGVAQLAERQPSKLHVAGSNPVSRSTHPDRIAVAAARLRSTLARTVRLTPALAADAAALSAAYRTGDGPIPALLDARSVGAYAAARMPATFEAAARSMTEGAARLPGFAPRTLLDVGAGTGATAWAAAAVWPTLRAVTLIERETAAVQLGRELLAGSGDPALAAAGWRPADATTGSLPTSDLVAAAYVLGELPPGDITDLVERLWAATRGAIVLVEPGSRAGYGRIITARETLLEAGAHIAAPCPGDQPCPVAGSRVAWCHFLARLDRSSLHRRAKAAARSWEDEPYSYVVAARAAMAIDARPRVVLGRPRRRPGLVEIRVCDDGRIETAVISRRAGSAYRAARDLTWGDAIPVPLRTEG